MTEHKFKEFIKKYGFKPYADILESSFGQARFDNLDSACRDLGYVYLWVEKSKNALNVVYVGKTDGPMKARCNQHLKGFKGGSKVGKRHSENIIKGIREGKTYHVYTRKSKTCEFLGEKDISMSCIEEIAFIKRLELRYNKWRKPQE